MANNNAGALWVAKDINTGEPKKDKNNNNYLTGEILVDNQKIRIMVFKNFYKKEDKHPDYNICVNTTEGIKKPQLNIEPAISKPRYNQDNIKLDEIPF
jgi:hypothetical protein